MAENRNDFVSEERLYLDKAGKVVGADDPNRHSLLIRAGGTLPFEEAQKYGLLKEDEGEGDAAEEGEDEETEPKKAAAKPAQKLTKRKK